MWSLQEEPIVQSQHPTMRVDELRRGFSWPDNDGDKEDEYKQRHVVLHTPTHQTAPYIQSECYLTELTEQK